MSRVTNLDYRFVEYIPEENEIEEGVLYISGTYATAVHKCCCGCGSQVVTPFSPTDWNLLFDGVSVTLRPSIGNWEFPCRSHYFITRNKISWAGDWSKKKVEDGRESDKIAKREYYEEEQNKRSASAPVEEPISVEPVEEVEQEKPSSIPATSWLQKMKRGLLSILGHKD